MPKTRKTRSIEATPQLPAESLDTRSRPKGFEPSSLRSLDVTIHLDAAGEARCIDVVARVSARSSQTSLPFGRRGDSSAQALARQTLFAWFSVRQSLSSNVFPSKADQRIDNRPSAVVVSRSHQNMRREITARCW